jgi:hypothetical protein
MPGGKQPGNDYLNGGDGDDLLVVRDGNGGDAVECGPGKNDRAFVDPGDLVKAQDCELLN